MEGAQHTPISDRAPNADDCSIANGVSDTARAAPLRASEHGATLIEPLHVRVGINAGEPIEEDGDLLGATVILASRIAATADAGEILVSDNIRSLCSAKASSSPIAASSSPRGLRSRCGCTR